jgi:acetate---CoA ligase (ADP-forming)
VFEGSVTVELCLDIRGLLTRDEGERVLMTNRSESSDRWPHEVVLRDGATVRIRPASIDDQRAVEWLLQELSREAQASRFGKVLGVEELRSEAERICTSDRRFTLLATVGSPERVVAEGGFTPTGDDQARLSVTVAESERGRGLATHLLGALASSARERGIRECVAIADPENWGMVNVIAESGFPVEVEIEPSRLLMRFPTDLTTNTVRQFELRDRHSSAQAVRRFFEPESVAVIGASRNRNGISGTLFHNLLRGNFHGPVYPVNKTANVVQSVPSYRSVEDIPGKVDLAVITVPAPAVQEAVQECMNKGVNSLVIISAGFSESGDQGAQRQRKLVEQCRTAGIRIIGPNCMGILNTDPGIGLDATFAPQRPPAGNIAFASQSGALGLAIIEFAEELGLGVSSFVSLGNKADISGNDLLCFWDEDERTDVILLYLESFGNPRRFSQISRDVSRHKPIVAVKSGRSSSGQRAAASHTGALLGAADSTVDALFRQSGVIRTDTLAEMFDVASLLSSQPIPPGSRVGVITNAGGPGILCADALEANDVEVPELSAPTQDRLASFLPPHAGFSNPVDLIASASSNDYRQAVEAVLTDEQIDAVIVINIPIADPVETVYRDVVRGVEEVGTNKPVLFVSMTATQASAALRSRENPIPVFTYPEAAARALSRSIQYAEWARRPQPHVPEFDDIRPGEAASIVADALGNNQEWLDPAACWQLLDCYGLPAVSQRVVDEIDQIPSVASQLGSRLVLKAYGPDLLHKTEYGAVQVNLAGADEAVAAAQEMKQTLEGAGIEVESWVLQSMAEDGVEMLIGAAHDPQFGPVVVLGAGGVMVELMHDISFRLAPLSRADVAEMIREVKTTQLLTGFRGEPERDVAALEDALLRLGKLVDDVPQIAELDCNPVFVHNQGTTVVDARIRVAPNGQLPE